MGRREPRSSQGARGGEASGVIRPQKGWKGRAGLPKSARDTPVENHRFLLPDPARQIAAAHGTPCYVYDQATLEAQADAMLAFPNAFGLTVRFA
ncbi:MAG: hypothetical protein ACOVMC_04785, partial [Opitutales bacterium]